MFQSVEVVTCVASSIDNIFQHNIVILTQLFQFHPFVKYDDTSLFTHLYKFPLRGETPRTLFSSWTENRHCTYLLTFLSTPLQYLSNDTQAGTDFFFRTAPISSATFSGYSVFYPGSTADDFPGSAFTGLESTFSGSASNFLRSTYKPLK